MEQARRICIVNGFNFGRIAGAVLMVAGVALIPRFQEEPG